MHITPFGLTGYAVIMPSVATIVYGAGIDIAEKGKKKSETYDSGSVLECFAKAR